jgi:hypothetical protein
LIRSSSFFHDLPTLTSFCPQFFLSSKNSIKSRFTDVVWKQKHGYTAEVAL